MTFEDLTARIRDSFLREYVQSYINSLEPLLGRTPASCSLHHAYEGGLIDHTREVVEIGLNIIEGCRLDVNRSHYVAAALLHDMGKVGAYTRDTETGRWIHVERSVRGDHSLEPIIRFAASPNWLPIPVQIAILSHMGGWSKTSVYPDTLLAAVLHSADLISSRLKWGGGFET